MKSNEKLKNFFLKLLCYHVDNNCNEKNKKFFHLIYSVNQCKKCDYSFKDTLPFLNQNINAKIIVLLEPFFLNPQFSPNDLDKISELFQKILNSIHLNHDMAYFTFLMKCDFFHKKIVQKDRCKETVLKEIELIQPEYILGFGKSVAEILLGQKVQLNEQKYHSFQNAKLFISSSPVDIYYNPSLKKEVWDFLKFIRDNYLKGVRDQGTGVR